MKASEYLQRVSARGSGIKLCRIETIHGLRLAWHAGADFVGLHVIFRLSQARKDKLARLVAELQSLRSARVARSRLGTCEPVLVTRAWNSPTLVTWSKTVGVTTLQLHTPKLETYDLKRLRAAAARFGLGDLAIIKTLAARTPTSFALDTSKWARSVDAVLFDASFRGGTGRIANWRAVQEAVKGSPQLPAFIAGGIRPATASAALRETGCRVVDVQTGCECIPADGKRKRKDVRLVLELCANVHGRPLKKVVAHYRQERVAARVLLALSDLDPGTRGTLLRDVENLSVDGVQIDVSDGTFIPSWPLDPCSIARALWRHGPEVPLWLHLFSRSSSHCMRAVDEISRANPHLVGIHLQVPPDASLNDWIAEFRGCARRHRFCWIPSLDARLLCRMRSTQMERLLKETRTVSGGTVLITASSEDEALRKRSETLTCAIEKVHAVGASNMRVGVDRAISPALLRAVKSPPDFVVAGRAFLRGDPESVVRSFRKLVAPVFR